MSTTYDARELGQTAVSIGGVSSFLKKHWRAIQQWRDRRRVLAALDYLSDRELRDIGIARGEIDYIARAPISADPRDGASALLAGEQATLVS